MIYSETTQNFLVQVEPSYVLEHSIPEENHYFFAYSIRIQNLGTKKAQLASRQWIIVDGNKKREVVEGDGVVGEQPFFDPGTTYEYTSFCPLSTPTGNMRGSYVMIDDEGNTFRIKVPLFFLRDHAHDQ